MARWEPAARERLQKAALELFVANGFDETTVADIAAAVGLTERTFYRYFTDKREVLFGGQQEFRQGFIDGVTAAAPDARPLDIVAASVAGVCRASHVFNEERRPYSRLRQKVIAAHPELQERELLKMASLAGVLAAALRERGVTEPAASLAAESGVTVFRLSFEHWIADGSVETLSEIESAMFEVLRELPGGPQ
ncbi:MULTISPECIES: TetR family transcriptional regulator [Subtercola]|uniref:TetR family transcriptional regulator n=1 Tax=Subtercola vilae TaxID=2056433 RepID=A0A4T2BTV5_9MICO|nr:MULTISPECIES: TetR family transcriptional regulator [Subtercola]MEA9985644.1 TetR family transcriptional regulator [Subtercola sp. RTI3]TIH34867.1 TetR family transcriptional regulator [Subtercola vilae]